MPDRAVIDYPGQSATPTEIRALAHEYRRAAHLLAPEGRRGDPLSRAPYRLLAIQATELFLNAFLMERGQRAGELRGLQHDLGARTDLAVAAGLALRARTRAHLHALRDGREYLVARYGPERVANASHVNRLAATLEEVARKSCLAGAACSSNLLGRETSKGRRPQA